MGAEEEGAAQKKLEERLTAINLGEREKEAQRIAEKSKLPYIDLSIAPIESQAVWLVPETQARRAGVAVLHTLKKGEGGKLVQIALQDPKSEEALALIETLKTNFSEVDLFVASRRSLEKAWERYLEAPAESAVITGEVEMDSAEIEKLRKEIQTPEDVADLIKKDPSQKASDLLKIIIAGALQTDASDIHLEFKEEKNLLRYRIDGILRDVLELSPSAHQALTGRIKLLSEMMLNRQDIAQDGRFTISLQETKIEIRVSVIPAAYGENTVMRVLNPKSISLGLEDLGFRKDALELLKNEIKKPNGMIITTGPTGSGKTTVLYAFVREIATSENKVVTLEDPIEYHLPQITQTQIEPEKGYDFAKGLRAILRQDPDVVLVGEIRDKETAEIAVHAALTGHLLFSTLHTNDAAGAVPRLVDMGINAAILSSALSDILAQRLVRRLCEKCREKITAQDNDQEFIEQAIASMPEKLKQGRQKKNYEIFRAKGCPACGQTGYKGRVGIFEILRVDDEMEKLIAKSPSHAEIKEAMLKNGDATMLHDGVIKVLEGLTSVEEIRSAVGEE